MGVVYSVGNQTGISCCIDCGDCPSMRVKKFHGMSFCANASMWSARTIQKGKCVMGEFFLRFARNGHCFLLGLGSLADISGKSFMSFEPQEEGISGIGRDFQAVGDDIRFAMSQQKALMPPKDQDQLELALH